MNTTLDQLLHAARRRIEPHEADVLLAHVLNTPRSWLFAHGDATLPADTCARFEALITRRECGEPIAYLTGVCGFYGLELNVTPDTLIPRPETELLVECALARLPPQAACKGWPAQPLAPRSSAERAVCGVANPRHNYSYGCGLRLASHPAPQRPLTAQGYSGHPKVLDLGTGSGAIALAIAHARPDAHVTASDRSPAALDVARSNARQLDLANVACLESDWYTALDGQRFDVIASNPPYIAAADPHLKQGDLRFEPRCALTPEGDGLDALRRIVNGAPAHLVPGGWLLLEHGHDQGAAVRDLLRNAGFSEVSTGRDLEQRERVGIGRLPG